MNNFYLTLPSNSSMDVYPSNTMTNFKTRLPNRIELDGRWEVGLVEIQYPHSWYNLQEDQGEITFTHFPSNALTSYTVHVPPGYYSSIDELLRRMEKEFRTVAGTSRNPVTLDYDEITKKITVENDDCHFAIGSKFQRILGFETDEIFDGKTTATLPVDMDPLHSIYVYCDLVEPRVVGDKLTPLLRVVPVTGTTGEMVTRSYENVHYVTVQQKSLETVEINIRDDQGENVSFERGTLNVTLHFRRKRYLL